MAVLSLSHMFCLLSSNSKFFQLKYEMWTLAITFPQLSKYYNLHCTPHFQVIIIDIKESPSLTCFAFFPDYTQRDTMNFIFMQTRLSHRPCPTTITIS